MNAWNKFCEALLSKILYYNDEKVNGFTYEVTFDEDSATVESHNTKGPFKSITLSKEEYNNRSISDDFLIERLFRQVY